MPENALAGGEEDIGGNKPADFGVIVPALEVVEPGFGGGSFPPGLCLFIRLLAEIRCLRIFLKSTLHLCL